MHVARTRVRPIVYLRDIILIDKRLMIFAPLLLVAATSPPAAGVGGERLHVGITPILGAAAVLLPLAPGGGERRVVRRSAAGDIEIDAPSVSALICATASDAATQCRSARKS